MELPKRNVLEFKFARQLSRLTSEQRIKLGSYLGYPPDLNNVPDSFWQEVEEENNNLIYNWWAATFLASALMHGLEYKRADQIAQETAAAQARIQAQLINSTTKKRLASLGDDWLENIRNDNMSRGAILQDLVPLFGSKRTENIVVTTITQAQSQGGETAVNETGRQSWEDKWFTVEDGRVCPICQPLHGTKREFWTRYFPSGPPAHNMCRCWIDYFLIG
jgi:hypothetical protein